MEQIGKLLLASKQSGLATISQLQQESANFLDLELIRAADNAKTELMPGYLRDWLAVLADGLGAFTPAELRYAFTKHKATSEFMPNMSNIVTLVKLKREADRDAADINRTAKLIAELKAARLDAQRPERQEETKQLMDALKAKIFGATNSEYSGA